MEQAFSVRVSLGTAWTWKMEANVSNADFNSTADKVAN